MCKTRRTRIQEVKLIEHVMEVEDDESQSLGEERNKAVSFFFNDTATTEIYTLSLHDALPIWN